MQWSAFGAKYQDTECVRGLLLDLDSLRESDQPCPLCDPQGAFDYYWGGTYVEPTCLVCLTRLPVSSVTFIDGRALTWTVDCSECGKTQPGLMLDYEKEASDD